MRPSRIELEGLFAYRRRTTLDLRGIDYFSLEGPTGSGKSSLIDAMVLALYGKVPRLGGASVAPAISAGSDRARVSFDFEVDGETHTATRQLERTDAGGARATEVRLQRGDTVLASGSGDVTSAVTDLLNLSYEDFTRTVVLPQGEFARFLTATPKERQELLRGLLGLDVYREMAMLARAREQLARSVASSATARLEELDVATEEDLAALIERLEAIQKLSSDVETIEATANQANRELDEARSRLDTAIDADDRLSRLAAPPRLEELASLLSAADAKVEDLRDALDASSQTLTKHQEVLAELPSQESLERFDGLYARAREVEDEIGSIDLENYRLALRDAEARVVESQAELDEARRLAELTRVEHAAHALAGSLTVGEDCPVCGEVVSKLPPDIDLGSLDLAEAGVVATEEKVSSARSAVGTKSTELARLEATIERLEATRGELATDLEDSPGAEEIQPLLVQARDVKSAIGEMEREIARHREQLGDAEESRAVLAEEQRSLGKLLMAEREKLADMKPPIAESEDVLVQWKELITWSAAKRDDIGSDRKDLIAGITAIEERVNAIGAALVERLQALGISAEGQASVAVARAEEVARHQVQATIDTREQAVKLRAEVSERVSEADLAEALARHLRSDGFERWMMSGAIADLVAGANSILGALSESSYSLHSDEDGSFDIVDHRNADEIRPVSTLSGGETFLVSLALALSLAETLSAGGGSRLDAIILDEGFGTLDEESLDVVATVLESLTDGGLMVGMITHVKALASRAPVRFRVHKGPEGSRVEVLQ